MAYSAYQYSGGILYPEHASQIVVDSAADIASINLDAVAPGTRVVDCSSGSMYILSPSKQWKLVQNSVAAAAKAVVTESASGDIAVFTDGADDVPVKNLVATITPVQSGSGDPSPTNIRPISGRTGLTVKRCGRNLIPYPYAAQAGTYSGVTVTVNDDGTLVLNGTATANMFFNLIKGDSPIQLPAGRYILHKPCATNIDGIRTEISKNGRWLGLAENSDASLTLTESADITIYIRVDNGTTLSNVKVYPMVEAGTSATDYTPYAGQTYPITWESIAGTIYGGTLDVVSGVLTVDKVLIDLGSITNWRYNADNTGTFDTNGELNPIAKNNDCICTNYKTLGWPSAAAITGGDMFVAINRKDDGTRYAGTYAAGTLIVKDSRYSDVESFKAAMDGVMLCYTLATPQTYQLTPTEVRTILGGNNIYTDAGAVSVEYVADTKLYIDNKVAELQALILEN